GRGVGGGRRTDNGARARAVLDDHLLAKGRREFLRNHSAHRVRTAAGRVWHNQRNRTRRIVLRLRRERPRRRRATDQRDELASLHSITSSARASSVGGAVAAWRLMRSRILCGNPPGTWAGSPPLSILPTKSARR